MARGGREKNIVRREAVFHNTPLPHKGVDESNNLEAARRSLSPSLCVLKLLFGMGSVVARISCAIGYAAIVRVAAVVPGLPLLFSDG